MELLQFIFNIGNKQSDDRMNTECDYLINWTLIGSIRLEWNEYYDINEWCKSNKKCNQSSGSSRCSTFAVPYKSKCIQCSMRCNKRLRQIRQNNPIPRPIIVRSVITLKSLKSAQEKFDYVLKAMTLRRDAMRKSDMFQSNYPTSHKMYNDILFITNANGTFMASTKL